MALYSSVLQMYLNWANSLLCERGVLVTDIEELQDGRIFALLIDVLNNVEINYTETEDEDETALNQLQAIVDYLNIQGINLKSSAKDILKGDVKSLLDLLWVLILHFTIHNKETPSGRRTLRQGRLTLMEWCSDQLTEDKFKMHVSIGEKCDDEAIGVRYLSDCNQTVQNQVETYSMIQVNVNYFKGNNNLAELVEIYTPVLPGEGNLENSQVGRLSTALIAVEETLGILKSLLSPADVIHGTANEYSIMIFLALLKRKVNLLVPESDAEPSVSPEPIQGTTDGVSEPWASLLHNTFSFKFVRVESLWDRLNLLKSSLAASASSPNAPQDTTLLLSGQKGDESIAKDFGSSSKIRREFLSHLSTGHEANITRRTGELLTNGVANPKESDQEERDCSSEAKEELENGFPSLSHDATVDHRDDVTVSGNKMEADEAVVYEEPKQTNGFVDFHEMDGVVSDYKEKSADHLKWKISTKESSSVTTVKTFSASSAVGHSLSTSKNSFEDELLGLLEMIGVEGKQLRQKLDSAQEREVYLLEQLQETVTGKHEEKVISRLVQELEMLRKENRRLFRELADAKNEVSLKQQAFDNLQSRYHRLEAELCEAKSAAGSRGQGFRGEHNVMVQSKNPSGDNQQSHSILDKMMKRISEENKQLKDQLSVIKANASHSHDKNRQAVKTAQEENNGLRTKCQKLTRTIETMAMDLETKEKRMGRYERYLEILRQQNAKLISHIGGEPLEGDGRVDVAKMELEEVKEEYKELRRRLEIAEEDRILLNRELDQIKGGSSSRIDSDTMETAFPEFHSLPNLETQKPKTDKATRGEETTEKTLVMNLSMSSGKQDSSSQVTSETISRRGEAEGSSNDTENAEKVLPEVIRTSTFGHLSDISSLRSYDVSESETIQSDSDYTFEEYTTGTKLTRSKLVQGGVHGQALRSFRSPSLGSLIRAQATEDRSEANECDDVDKKMTKSSMRGSESKVNPRSGRSVFGSVETDHGRGTILKKSASGDSVASHRDHSIYYTPTLNLPTDGQSTGERLFESSGDARGGPAVPPVHCQMPLKDRLGASQSESNLVRSRESRSSGTSRLNTVQSECNLYYKSKESISYHGDVVSQRSREPYNGSSRVPRWRQLRYSKGKNISYPKMGEAIANRIPSSSKEVPPLYASSPLNKGSENRVETYYTPMANMDGYGDRHFSLQSNSSIPVDNEDEFQRLPDQLTEHKKLADVTPPRNQKFSPRSHGADSAVRTRLSFEETSPNAVTEKKISPARYPLTGATLRDGNSKYEELTSKLSEGTISGHRHQEEQKAPLGGDADVMALRVIRKADSGISLGSIGYDSASQTGKEVSYIHKMLSPADQCYANSIIDKYLSKT